VKSDERRALWWGDANLEQVKMAIGDIKQFDISAGGVVLMVNAIDMGGGTVQFDIISKPGSAPADINAIYWGDNGVADNAQLNLGGSLNMNGSAIDFDGGVVISQPGSSGGINVLAKPSYLTAGESYQKTYTGAVGFFESIDNLGVRATSTGFDGAGSIKGTDGEPTVIPAPEISIGDACVVEGNPGDDVNATFTVSLDHVYAYDVYVNWAPQGELGGINGLDLDNGFIGGTLKIDAGQLTGTILVPINEDGIVEGNEAFSIRLTGGRADIPGPDIGVVISDGLGAGEIKNDDHAPVAVDDKPEDCAVEGGPAITGSVFDNDSDADGDAIHLVSVTWEGGGSHNFADADQVVFDAGDGTVTLNKDGSYSYVGSSDVPDNTMVEDVFHYVAADVYGNLSNEASVTLCLDAAPPPPPPEEEEEGAGLSPGAYATAGGEGAIPLALASISFDDFFGLDAPAERTWTDAGVAFTDLTFTHTLQQNNTNGSAFSMSQGPNDSTTPNMVGGDAELQLVREASVAAANFYSTEIDHNAFVTQLKDALDMAPSATDAQVLAEFKSQVNATFNSNDVADYTNLTIALADTHH
jgi:Bacterial cadherin-like domain